MVTIDKVKIGDIVEITWKDCAGDSKIDLSEIKDIPPRELLVETKTYGTILNIDNEAVVIAQESSESGGDYTVIFNPCIVNITKFNKKKFTKR